MTYKSEASPIFIGGLYKSGTSLLRAMLSQHSNIAGGLETFWFDLRYSNRENGSPTFRNWDATRNEPLYEHVTRLAKFYDFESGWALDLSERCSSGEEFIDLFMAEYANKHGKKRWVEKTPANVLHIERIHNCWPQGCFIHVVRDPRDVYSSVCRSGKWSQPHEFAKLWKTFMDAFTLGNKCVPDTSIIEIKYEDLVLNPVHTMQRLLDFIGEFWEPSVAEYEGESKDYEKVSSITGKSSLTLEQLRNPLLTTRVGAWRDELSCIDDLDNLEREIKKTNCIDLWNSYKH